MQSLWMLFAGLAFAVMSVLAKLATEFHAVAEVIFWRALVQMVVAWAMLLRSGGSVRTARLGMHVHRGVSGFVSMFLFFYALTALPVATAMTLSYTSPIFLAILLTVLARERPDAWLVAAVLAGFAGVALLLKPAYAADAFWPGLIGLTAGAISSVSYWNIRELVRAGEPEARIVFYFSLFALMGSLVWMAPQTWHMPTEHSFWLVFGVCVMGALGQFAMTRAYGQGTALVTAALSYSGVVFSSLIGIAVFGDLLPLTAWIGMALIVAAGIAAVQLRPGRREDAAAQIPGD